MIGPIVEELAGEYGEKAVIGKVNVDNNRDIAMKYRVMNIPTILFIKDGKEIDRIVGAVPKNVLQEKLDAALTN